MGRALSLEITVWSSLETAVLKHVSANVTLVFGCGVCVSVQAHALKHQALMSEFPYT